MNLVLGWRAMYEQLLKDKRPRELNRMRRAGEAEAREVVTAQMVEEIEAIPKWSPEETARRQALQAIPDVVSGAPRARVFPGLPVPDLRPLLTSVEARMTTYVASVLPQVRPGDTVLVDGHPMVVLHLLPHHRGQPTAARLTSDLPCGTCEGPLCYDALRRRWRCSECQTTYDGGALADLVREHVRGVRASNTRRNRSSRTRQVVRGAPGAATVLLRAACCRCWWRPQPRRAAG